MEIFSNGRADEPIDYKKEFQIYNNVSITKDDCAYDDSKSLIESIVPSKDMREYHKSLNYTYSDRIIAALISWSDMPYFRKLDALKKVRNESDDDDLIKQLNDYIDYMEYSFKSVKFDEDRKCIYRLDVQWNDDGEYEENGYFIKYEDALDFSKRAINVRKSIEKICIIKSKEDYADIEDEYIYNNAGSVTLDRDGTVIYCWAGDVPEPYIEEAFYSSYIPIPYPFRQGDIVKILNDNNRLGLVQGSKTEAEIEAEYEKFKDNFDYSDYQVIVESYYYDSSDDSFGWNHQHVSPLNLELVDIDRSIVGEGTEENLYLIASNLVKGEGVLWGLEYAETKYRKWFREQKDKN